MKLSIYVIISAVCFSISSCCGCWGDEEEETTTTAHIDTHKIDTLTNNDSSLDDSGYVDNEEEDIANAIEEKYGVQWDFCDCVVKNDSVNGAIEDAESDADFDKVLARMEVIDQHCKELLTTPNTTPDERAKHERRVRKCLTNAR